MNIIVKMKFGSHLYGTDTKDSDIDYKGIFLPTEKEILLNKVPKSYNHTTKSGNDQKNTSEDIDTEFYSLHYFIKLACEGQTVALDMLHAPTKMIEETSPTWQAIVSNRKKFYTKNLKAFIGYARRQAAKYGIKGSRLNIANFAMQVIRHGFSANKTLKLKNIWDQLPITDDSRMLGPNPNGIQEYQICGKILQETVTCEYAYNILKTFYEAYGKRAKEAAENKGVDWKAISHALRAAYQVKELLSDGTITFPLKNADFLKQVKNGHYDYTKIVAPTLEALMTEVEILSEESIFPERADQKFWENFIINTVRDHVL